MTKIKAKIFFLAAISLFALASLLLTIVNYNPYNSDSSVFITFYVSLLISLTGIFSFLIIFIKSRLTEENIFLRSFWGSLRQSSLLAIIITLLLALKGLKVLDLWVSVPLSIAIVMVEMYIRGISRNKKHAT
jgi:hypothetical protein